MKEKERSSWAADEFEAVDLTDKRLDRRLVKICESMAESPESPINQACADWAEAKAAYRFFQNEDVSADSMLKAYSAKTASHSQGRDTVLAIQDTSYLVYTSHAKTKGLGGISMAKGRNVDRMYSKGLVMHTCMAVAEDGLPLGILNQSVFARKPKGESPRSSRSSAPAEEKESYRWIESLELAERSKGQANMVTGLRPRGGLLRLPSRRRAHGRVGLGESQHIPRRRQEVEVRGEGRSQAVGPH